ncbi:thioesterase [Paraburkholderia sp. NMBU_R16]|uniref:thioesterase family protein n=2 Tax=Burkholderiaceae TaxID=119060 RepID=UPI0015649CFC|nr:thioesterase family protein [Paraburkholderia sp. NMBU_R16]NRO95628.1 thioesterase [Paraburkholderia sp. NMBU_R16]
MKLLARLAFVSIRAMLRPNLAALDASECHFRVLPTDLDVQLHMNNGRFLQIMDLGRIDLLLRNGVLQNAMSKGWRMLLSGVMIRYVHELRPFERYALRTRILGWDRRFFYIEHRFENSKGRLVALGTARAAIADRASRSLVPADHVAADHGHAKSPALPFFVRTWNESDSQMRKEASAIERQQDAAQRSDELDWRRWGLHPAMNERVPMPEEAPSLHEEIGNMPVPLNSLEGTAST